LPISTILIYMMLLYILMKLETNKNNNSSPYTDNLRGISSYNMNI